MTVGGVVRKIFGGSLLCCGMLHLTGCSSPSFSAVKDVNPSLWDSSVLITAQCTDTVTLRDIGLFLRTNDRFTEDTLTLRIRLLTPDTLRHDELLRLTLPHANTPAAIMRETNVAYRRRVHFARSGNYRLTIAPCRPVKGIEAVGVYIVKSE